MNKQFLPRAGQVLLLLALVGGCVKPSQEFREKAPRPVTTITLAKSVPASSFNVSGAVKSWKTEQIGFEVAGRVQWVLEPGKNIDGRVKDADGNQIPGKEGTPLAKIDSERLQIARDAALASLEVTQLQEEVALIQLNNIIVSEIPSARSNVSLARADFERIEKLRQQNAISQSEYEEADNRLKTANSRLATLISNEKKAEAQQKSAQAATRNAEQTLEDAKRNLLDTELHASYRGQISEVHVVPGSVVAAGSPVLTLQMMTPIKIEVEVSAEQSREIQRRRQVPISYALPDGSRRRQKAFVYMVDPSADPSTRTFTVVLLVINEQYRPNLDPELQGLNVARTQDIWPLKLNELLGMTNHNAWFIEENCILTDETGSYVWLLEGVLFGEDLPDVVKLKKYPVTAGTLRIPFLGNWTWQAVTFADPAVDATRVVAGPLEFIDVAPDKWDGQSLVVDHGLQWRLRPGDLVDVNLSDQELSDGYYVPVETIYEEMKSTYVFVVDGDVARKTEVKANLPNELDAGSMVRIEPLGTTDFATDTRIVLGGVHFLSDGEKINVVSELDISPAIDLPAPEIPADDSPTKTSMTGAGERP